MTILELRNDMNATKARLKQKWDKLTDDDLRCAVGKYDELLDRIQKRTGETRATVEDAIRASCHAGGLN